MNRNLKKAENILKKGGVITFPTDTAFGIGCIATDEKAVKRVFKIRKRPSDKAVLILASSYKMAREYAKEFNKNADMLAKKYWPGGITIIVEGNKSKVSSFIMGGGDNIGIRVPAHSTIRRLIKRIGIPLIAPSANFSGDKTPFRQSEINPELKKLVDYNLSGRCRIKEPSTVVDATGGSIKVIRKGAIAI